VLVVLVAATGGTVASAARLTFSTAGIGAGTAAVSRCDTSVTATMTTSGASVTGVTVADVAAACAGGRLTATITNAGAPLVTLDPVTVPAGGGSVAITVPAPQPAFANVTDVRVVVVGP
jgi:hypothetical protein